MKDYKDTLLMPKTDFEMRGNLNKKEPFFYAQWEEHNIAKKIDTKGKKEFILHDGPPYANGNLHVGHALNKYLKDFVNRSKSMQGYKLNYRYGWDTHGLPIELAIQKKGNDLKNNTIIEYINKCKNYALEQVEIQKEQMKKFQLVSSLSNTYLTLDKEYEYNQIKLFHSLLNQNLIYQDLKPVYWSWSIQSALAESEIEYYDKKSQSILVKFRSKTTDYSAIIWTTTPWTIPANVAIAFNKDFEYLIYETKKYGKIILEKNLSKDILNKINESSAKVLKSKKGSDFENEMFINPLNNKFSLATLSDHIMLENGTGIVHIASGHGFDDFMVAKKYKLEVFSVLDEKGVMNKNSGEFEGEFYLKADLKIIEKLKINNGLLLNEEIIHSYPHDWRTKKPLVFRATKQWFINIKKIESNLIKEINRVNWIPEWGKTRMINMMSNRQDWCISRQRIWGVPIPIVYDENNEYVKDLKFQSNIENLIRENGSRIWFEKELKDLVPKSYKFNSNWKKEMDTMDVWFDSGSSHIQIWNEAKNGIDLYLEGNDQYRGWFNTSLITSYALRKSAPYKSVLTHGFVVDKNGIKMSKSKNNIIDPLKVINQFGSDVLRLWVANSDYQREVRISDEIIKQTSDQYRKIRNTFKFILGNLFDFDINKNKPEKLLDVDYLILNKLDKILKDAIQNYNNYNFNKIITSIVNFFITDLSNFYFEFLKDILYIHNSNSLRRRQVQFTIYSILDSTLKILAPIIPTTTEEAYQFLNKKKEFKSIHLEEFSSIEIETKKINTKKWETFFYIKDLFLKELEKVRDLKIVTKSINSDVEIMLTKDKASLLSKEELEDYLILANVNIVKGEEDKITIKLFNGQKCQRCWKTYLSSDMHKSEICKKCNNYINSN